MTSAATARVSHLCVPPVCSTCVSKCCKSQVGRESESSGMRLIAFLGFRLLLVYFSFGLSRFHTDAIDCECCCKSNDVGSRL